jgi:predicted O-methyltransferase YrrM
LAEKNFAAMGYGDRTTVRAEKAEDLIGEMPDDIDLVLLDAAGSNQHPDPAYRGKGIYAFMVEDVFSKMRDGALMAVHNDYLGDVGVNKLSKPFVDRSVEQLARFHAFCDKHFRKSHVAATPDGFGLYLK